MTEHLQKTPDHHHSQALTKIDITKEMSQDEVIQKLLASLNQGQREALIKIINKPEGMFLLEGHAGTGKTHLLRTIIEVLHHAKNKETPEGIKITSKFICLAPTHQALTQLSKLSEGNHFSTLASFLEVHPYSDEKTGEFIFSRPKDQQNSEYDYIFVDESSMLNYAEFNILEALSLSRAVIFIGDFAQLPPVKNRKVDFHKYINDKTALTEQMRNGDQILELCNHFRYETNFPSTQTAGNVTYFDDYDTMIDTFISFIKKDPRPHDTIYLAYTNKAMREVRSEIKSRIYNNENYPLNQWIRLEFINEIRDKEPLKKNRKKSKKRAISHTYQLRDGIIIESRTQVISLMKREFKAYLLKLKDEDGDIITHGRAYTDAMKSVLPEDPEWHMTLSFEDLDILQELTIKKYEENRKLFYKIKKTIPKDQQNGESPLEKAHEEGVFLVHQAQKLTKALSPYASTVHKAQGRTIKNVFLDAANILSFEFRSGSNTKELLYVGASRASEHLYIYV